MTFKYEEWLKLLPECANYDHVITTISHALSGIPKSRLAFRTPYPTLFTGASLFTYFTEWLTLG